MPETPCQKCKRERDELREELETTENARVAAWNVVRGLEKRVAELEAAIGEHDPDTFVGTAHERAVLDAMRCAGQSTLLSYANSTKGDWLGDACRAELARRAAEGPSG